MLFYVVILTVVAVVLFKAAVVEPSTTTSGSQDKNVSDVFNELVKQTQFLVGVEHGFYHRVIQLQNQFDQLLVGKQTVIDDVKSFAGRNNFRVCFDDLLVNENYYSSFVTDLSSEVVADWRVLMKRYRVIEQLHANFQKTVDVLQADLKMYELAEPGSVIRHMLDKLYERYVLMPA